jgi:hypothetical protein
MIDADLASCVGYVMPGSQCFAVDDGTWQSAVLEFVLFRRAGFPFSVDNIVQFLQHYEMLKEPFMLRRNWELDLVAHIRSHRPAFEPPTESVARYVESLVARDLLQRTGNRWRSDATMASRAKQVAVEAAESRRRHDTLLAKLTDLGHAVPMRLDEILRWSEQPIPGMDETPSALAAGGGDAWAQLERQLDAVAAMVRPGGLPLFAAELRGLPLEDVRLARETEERERHKETLRQQAEAARLAAERRRRESTDFVEQISVAAQNLLGEDRGRAWVEAAVCAVTSTAFDDARFALSLPLRNSIQADLDRERSRVERLRDEEWQRLEAKAEADAMGARCRAKLEMQAMASFETPDRAALWLKNTQLVQGWRPMEHCRDERTLTECLRLLDSTVVKSRRRR